MGQDFIFCFSWNESLLQMFTETGILCKTIDFKSITEKLGKPVEISEDGTFIIFRQSNISYNVSLIQVTFDGLIHVNTLDFRQEIINYCEYSPQTTELKLIKNFFNRFLGQLDNLKT